jgi:hypothetical protein
LVHYKSNYFFLTHQYLYTICVDKPVEKIIITPAKSMALPTIPPSLIMESGYAQYYTPFITLKSTLFFIFSLCTH